MKLAQFIQTTMEQRLKDWEQVLLEIAPRLENENSRELRDHARELLNFIAEDLSTSHTKEKSTGKALGEGRIPAPGVGGKHGSDRLHQGLSMLQLVQELQALRNRITWTWSNNQSGIDTQDIDQLLRFNEAVDQLIIGSVSSFSLLREQETRLIRTMLEGSVDPAAIFDSEGHFLFCNTAMADLINTSPRGVIGKTPHELGLDFFKELHEEIAKVISKGQSQRAELHHGLPSGIERYFDCYFAPVFDDRNEVEAIVKTAHDITERKQIELQSWRSANFDDLTALPNRRLFLDRLEQTLLEAQRKDSAFALLFIDLDRFKEANDQLGHEVGDRLLAQVAERLKSSVRAMDTVARLGGDEFTLILKDTSRENAKQTAKALLTSLEVPFSVNSHRVHISGSIGLAVFPGDGEEIGQLMHKADQAMYAGKDQGGHQVQLYEPWMTKVESEHMRLHRELDHALRENQLEVYYQPIVDTQTGAVVRAEALLRWHHPAKGLLTPDAFLSVTEQNGMMDSITNYVLAQAAACSSRWRRTNASPFPININESPASFATRSLVDNWRDRRAEVDMEESRITMELTPASFNNIQASSHNPGHDTAFPGPRLKLAIDNFGIELFSLLALQETDLECVKIDRDLVKNAGQGGKTDRVLKGLIAMAHAINVQVVGVGVEKEEQLQFLARAGCDYAQGFLFSQPIHQNAFEALLEQSRQSHPG
ncbi:putative bifunctional diguanylate cyclase/phosphodiesterase [Marinimicrobium locisalis]|uniref:putative bifunctional diguanylate cyclase/phosphodiesterase n=1 Tax=Marinimicrobium locisalis TaxID=546022 RepID=UPI0032215AC4